MAAILGVSTAFPRHRYSQEVLTQQALQVWPAKAGPMVKKFFANVGVHHRHLARSVEHYHGSLSFQQRSEIFATEAVMLAEQCTTDVFDKCNVDAMMTQCVISTTVTGIMVPTLDTRLMNRIAMSPAVKRMPLFGLGCVAGVACVARGLDYLKAYPSDMVLVLSVELCSLALQRSDESVANLIASALFADGAAAVVMVGIDHPRYHEAPLQVLGSQSIFFPKTERVMGWDIKNEGFQVVLGPEVPRIVQEHMPSAVERFLKLHDVLLDDIRFWVAHPGGPKVIDAMQEAFSLPMGALMRTRESLAEVGNLSSASVLHVCQKFLGDPAFYALPENSLGLMLAMGPGFCAELVLIKKGEARRGK